MCRFIGFKVHQCRAFVLVVSIRCFLPAVRKLHTNLLGERLINTTVLAIEVGTWSTANSLFSVGQGIADRYFKVGIHVGHMSLTLTACKKDGTDTPC
jgi:hypothetical protein